MNRQPNLALSVEHTAQVAPGHGKVWLRLDRFQVAGLKVARTATGRIQVDERRNREEQSRLVYVLHICTQRGVRKQRNPARVQVAKARCTWFKFHE